MTGTCASTPADSAHVLFYGKMTPTRGTTSILVAVNLDPFAAHEARSSSRWTRSASPPTRPIEVHELLATSRAARARARHTVTLDPRTEPAHIFRVGRWRRRERDFDYYA